MTLKSNILSGFVDWKLSNKTLHNELNFSEVNKLQSTRWHISVTPWPCGSLEDPFCMTSACPLASVRVLWDKRSNCEENSCPSLPILEVPCCQSKLELKIEGIKSAYDKSSTLQVVLEEEPTITVVAQLWCRISASPMHPFMPPLLLPNDWYNCFSTTFPQCLWAQASAVLPKVASKGSFTTWN